MTRRCLFFLIFALLVKNAVADNIEYVNTAAENARIIDVRTEGDCLKRTVLNATCLPIESVMASRQRLANFSGLLWKLGTADLDGSEHVLLIGDSTLRKDAMAGIFHLAGQHRISILKTPVSEFSTDSNGWQFGKGRPTSTTRTQVWQSTMRSPQLVLHNEMVQHVQAANSFVLDGRSDAEYWGQQIHAHRGGHIPGADLSSYSNWLDDKPIDELNHNTIVYAADAYSGLAYYARLNANAAPVRLYLDGWVRWAAQTELPIDAAAYGGDSAPTVRQEYTVNRRLLIYWAASIAIAFACGYIICKAVSRKN